MTTYGRAFVRTQTVLPPHERYGRVPGDSCEVSFYGAPTNDPFVPNNSYKEILRSSSKNSHLTPMHLLYSKSGGYDDAVKAKLYQQKAEGQTRATIRQGRMGSKWSNVKEVLQGGGDRLVFIDGSPSVDKLHLIKQKLMSAPPTAHFKPPSSGIQKYETMSAYQATEGRNWAVMR